MRSSSIGIRHTVAIAVALTALTLLPGTAPQAQPLGVLAQASDDDDEPPPPRRRGVVPSEEESEAPDEREAKPLPRMGASRRLDPFDANEERKGPARAPHPAPAGAVVCEAGCDGPRGTIVYEKK